MEPFLQAENPLTRFAVGLSPIRLPEAVSIRTAGSSSQEPFVPRGYVDCLTSNVQVELHFGPNSRGVRISQAEAGSHAIGTSLSGIAGYWGV